MNRRQRKKKEKQLERWLEENHDFYDGVHYKTVPVRCNFCGYFEPGDSSVGLPDGCETPVLFDENDEIIDKMNNKIIKHMEHLGYGCPYFTKKPERRKVAV